MRVVVGVVAAVVAATAAVGVVARDVYQRPSSAAQDQIALPSGSSVPPSEQPGGPGVQLSIDAASHPDGTRVRDLLQRHFDSINARNYGDWVATVTAERADTTPEGDWLADYETTRDGSILVQRVESASPTRLRVMMVFTSTQDVTKAPRGLQADCIRWRVVYPLQEEGGTLRVDSSPGGSSSQYEPCA
ncbi:hypothetical protein [Actinosynnema sp. NPDC020468]|uniref:hypothetical protein n=1 Tax=Actinosynnema sp. NPDC020468 TaxID=3154488 RepID=UPI0033D040CC